jgi:hypothetical protein
MTFLSFRCFNGYREAKLNYELRFTHFKAIFFNISFAVKLSYICQLLTQNFSVFVLVTCATRIRVHKFLRRIYDCSYSLSPIKVRISGCYVPLVTVIEANLNVTIGRASLCFTEYKKSPLTKVFRAPSHNPGFYEGGPKNNRNLNVARELEVVAR